MTVFYTLAYVSNLLTATPMEDTTNNPHGVKFRNDLMDKPRRNSEVMYKAIYLALWEKSSEFRELSVEEEKNQLCLMLCAYQLAKANHRGQQRIGGNRYFDHLTGTTAILISEFPTLTFHQVIAAYLHDIIEDTKITLATIENIFGKRVAMIVDAVSKKDDLYYLRPDEKAHYETLGTEEQHAYLESKHSIIKARRTEHYFGHMEDLDAETLQVKFADRIHNLRDLPRCPIEKIREQIAETEKYLMPVAQQKNPTAYELMGKELEKLHILVEQQ